MAFDPFHSARLTYRAMEDADDDNTFLHSVQLDIEALSVNTRNLLAPQNKVQSKKLGEFLRDGCLLGVIICLNPGTDLNTTAEAVPIGFICLKLSEGKSSHSRASSIGLSIVRQYQNRGYGSEAIRWILGYGFEMAGLHRVGIEAFGFNARALHLYEKLGFVVEGRRREEVWFRGKWHDFVEFGMLESEWRKRQEEEGKSWIDDTAA
ncbi:acyl-CoA N-acyltransferase [Microdochium trichocladiopsis]|uniref:Acyl-CoA N-acyltransferase n=1 Tax=Microdochium trichocladiopsis TaxID=1682393 RepID=A0A9P8XS50_9PEZI|nr:acyl-CoA N-acyltransferase [Microdochium trichocladiopsis]KAH7014510.1 acyl-CoA N-acyltransferase [Microdochium trichocladiopsis]